MNLTGNGISKGARSILALFMMLLFLGSVIPNLGRVVVDHSTTPPTPHIVGQLAASLTAVGIAAVPFALVVIGTFRRVPVAIPGWIALAVLVLISLIR